MSEMVKRVELYKKLPLQTPFSLHVFPSYFCNFRCKYCLHSLSEDVLTKKGFKRQFMDFDTYKKAIDDCKAFDKKLKAIIFAGHGEPLMHPEISKMVAYVKEQNIANRVEIVTNGSLLTNNLSDDLIAAGLDRLRISVQGINGQAYENTMGKPFDFDKFIEQLKYFFIHKKNTEIYCKIIDVAMKSPEEEATFHKIFSEVSDETAIEYEIPFVQEIDNTALKNSFECSKQGNKATTAKVCAMPFYMMVLTPNGDIVPCCSTDIPIVMGNIKEESLKEIWDSARWKGFCRVHLLKNRDKHFICSKCSVPQFGMQMGDYLDDQAEDLLEKYPIKLGV